ncbi:unnamed protein product, partial [Rotaria magnacalcarata]
VSIHARRLNVIYTFAGIKIGGDDGSAGYPGLAGMKGRPGIPGE